MSYNLLYPPCACGPRVQVQSALPSAKRTSHLICLTSQAVPSKLLYHCPSCTRHGGHLGRCWFHPTHAWLSHSILNPVLPEYTTNKAVRPACTCNGQRLQGMDSFCGGRWYSSIRYGHQNNSLDQMDHFSDLIKRSVFLGATFVKTALEVWEGP